MSSSNGLPNGSGWGFARRWAFLSLFCYLILYYLPVILGVIPWTWWSVQWYSAALAKSAAAVFGFSAPSGSQLMSGGGENLFDVLEQELLLILAVAAGLAWSVVARHRKSYIGLQGWLWTWSRYGLAVMLITYGAAKVIPSQFGQLDSLRLAATYGQSSPMQLLWNMMAFSKPYTIFAGCAELLPGVLLLFRRTAPLGALIAFAVLVNVVMLNFCYDVPVKLHSVNYLILAALLVAPEARRLRHMFILNEPVEPSPLRMPHPARGRWPLAIMLAKVAFVGTIGFSAFSAALDQSHALAKQPPVPPSRLTQGSFSWIPQ